MKKILGVTLFAGFVLCRTALCQSSAMDNNSAANPSSGGDATNATSAVQMSTTDSAGENKMPAVEAHAIDAATNQPAAQATVESGAAGSQTASTGSQAAAEAAPGTPAGELPIDVKSTKITAAIEALARAAGINYLLDPKIGYGEPDEHGVIKPEPELTFHWEHITAQQALMAILDNYGLQLIENPKTKIAKITVKDPAAPPALVTRVIQLKYASTSNMVMAVQSGLSDKRSKVIPDTRTSQLVISATEREQADIDTMVAQLDRPTRQVLIETRLVELSSNPKTQKGVDWSGTLQAQHVAFGNNALPGIAPQPAIIGSGGTQTTPATQGVLGGLLPSPGTPQVIVDTAHGFNPSTAFLNADGVSAVLSFLNSSSDAQVVSTPRVVTLDNETATISVTRAFPIINVTAGTANTTGGSQLTYSNLGTILMVTPRISANDYIWLKVQPSVSSFFDTVTKVINGLQNQADEFDIRSIDTQVLIPNANTLVMGGLVQDNPNVSFTKVPLLGDIPIVGYAFRSEKKSAVKDNLLIFITPTIVKDADFHPTKTDFLNSKPRLIRGEINPHSWWDSGTPEGDWSNPVQQKPDGSPEPE